MVNDLFCLNIIINDFYDVYVYEYNFFEYIVYNFMNLKLDFIYYFCFLNIFFCMIIEIN